MGRLPDEISTRRLRLRLWSPDDVPALRAAIDASLDHLRPWLAWVPLEPVSDDDRTRFILAANEAWEQGGDAAYGVFRDGVVVGGCGLHHRWGPNTLDLGYWIHVDHIGHGYAQEVARGLTDAAFGVEGIDRVEIHHDKANERSRGVPMALGFVRGPEQPDDVGAPAELGIDCTWSISRSQWTARTADPHVTLDETDGMEAVVRRVRPDEGPLLKSVRLAALADSPSAFGSSYAAEADQPDDHWTDRAMLGAAGERGATFFAIWDGAVVGLVSAYRPDPAGLAAELVSMWVSPDHRRAGIATQLVTAVVGWAHQAGMATVELWVTRGNDAAVRLYETAGFRLTGHHQPLPSDPCRDELRMRLPLDRPAHEAALLGQRRRRSGRDTSERAERDDVGVADLQIRPTNEIRSVILGSMDRMFEQLIQRLDGLTDAEYLWEPASGSWSVRLTPDGKVVVDGTGDREIDPSPVTTIAWRLWHIAMDCLDDYTRRFGGDESDAPPTWTLDATVAIDITALKWREYRSMVAALDWWSELGDAWGYWSHHSVADMAMHASNELVHHGAEIALLRDLYRSSGAADTV